MSNRQSESFYFGTRYEYATTLCMSAIASVVNVPRPEDYGFDHICTYVDIQENLRYPKMTFGVQTKAESQQDLIFGDLDKNGIQKNGKLSGYSGENSLYSLPL